VVSDEQFTGYLKEVSHYMQSRTGDYDTMYVTYPFESPYIFYAFYNRMDPKEFLKTVSYYPVDRLGFRYAKTLGKMQYLNSNLDLKQLSQEQLNRALIFSRVEETLGVQPVKEWPSLGGKPEITAIEGKQLIK